MMNNFVHLNTKSDYSLSEGALTIEKIADLCSENNMPAIAVTDTNNLFGALEFSETISKSCLLDTSPSPRDVEEGRMPSAA